MKHAADGIEIRKALRVKPKGISASSLQFQSIRNRSEGRRLIPYVIERRALDAAGIFQISNDNFCFSYAPKISLAAITHMVQPITVSKTLQDAGWEKTGAEAWLRNRARKRTQRTRLPHRRRTQPVRLPTVWELSQAETPNVLTSGDFLPEGFLL